jgi:myo-inositol 2-dehydrogenase/D-chiro-inositol 1-dehydrogenase
MTQRFRLGLIGAGRMGRTHLQALAGSELIDVVGIAEPAEPIRASVAATGRTVHADIDGLLRDGGLDGVLVAVPSTVHLATIARLAEAGLPILCEKPCGVTAAQARQAAGLAAARAVPLQVAYWRRFVPALQALQARIAAGELGAIYHVACHQWDAAPPSPEFRASSGGILVDMGVHEFDQIRWLTGQEFTSLHTLFSPVSSSGGTESSQTLARLSGGATALVSLGQRFPLGDVCRVEVFGTKDAAECRFLWPPDADAAFHDALRRQAEGFAAMVRGGKAEGASAQDAVAALAAAEAASPG